MAKNKYYTLDRILSYKAIYNIIFGERSNGKTYAVQDYGLKKFIETGEQMAILRRWEEDFKGSRGQTTFGKLLFNGNGDNMVSKYTKGEYDNIIYYAHKWYLAKGVEKAEQPFCYAFSIGSMEHYKSTDYPNVTTILFDEFITREAYLPDEFILFQNTLSTIIRKRTNVTIFMCGNTVNKYGCPYWNEMGLNHIKNMKIGTIDLYTYGDSELSVAVEYTENGKSNKQSNKYFAFNNPKLQMITNGTWEMDIYPHLPFKYAPKDIIYIYYIQYEGNILQCNIIEKNECLFTFIHRKTTPIPDNDERLVYQVEPDPRPNYRQKITKIIRPFERRLMEQFVSGKVFYQNNDIGELVRSYLTWCKQI